MKCIKSLDHGNGTVLLFTGGGRAQLKVWRILNLNGELVGSELADYMLRGSDKDVRRAWREAQSVVRHDPETRFLSIELVKKIDQVYIYVGCSDSILRIFMFSHNKISLLREEKVQEHCFLQVKHISLNQDGFILSSTTGGSIFVWSSKDILSEDYYEFKLHQSGINSLDVQENETYCLLISGGDDNALVLSKVQHINGVISHAVLWREEKAHAAQITGVHFRGKKISTIEKTFRKTIFKYRNVELVFNLGSSLISVSVDQRIGLWEREEKCEGFKLTKVKFSNIADIQDTLSFRVQDTHLLCTVGIGIQIFYY